MTGSEAKMQEVTKNDGSALGRIRVLVILVAVVVLASMAYIYYAGRRINAVHRPLISAAMQIKLEATTAQ